MENPPNLPNPPPVNPPAITPEELHRAIEKARLEEREKLRSQLTASEEQSKGLKTELEKTQSQFKTLEGQLGKMTSDYDAIKAGLKTDGGVDVEKAIDRAVTAVSSRMATEYDKKLQALGAELEVERTNRQRLTVEQRRVQLIADAGGETVLIPELVTGSNENELKESIERSKQVFQRTVAKVGTPPITLPPGHAPGEGVPPVVPVVPAGTTTGVPPTPIAAAGSRRLNMKEYAAQRETLKKQAAARYPTNLVTQR